MKNNLLVLTRQPEWEEFESTLNSFNLPELEIILARSESDIENHIGKCNILLANPPIAKNWINKAENLVWMQSTFAGIDAMVASDLKREYQLTNVRDTYGNVMSEWVFAYILMFHKKVLENLEWQKESNWNQIPYKTVAEKTICILGAGSIGRHIASVAKAFGMKTLGLNSSGSKVEHFDLTFTKAESHKFLPSCDFIVSVLPNTKDTKNFIDKDFLGLMNEEAVFMSIGRGDNVNEDDLVEALTCKKIKAAVLDVFKTEPLPADSKLWNIPNLFITPHVSGYSLSKEIFKIFKENYMRFYRGEDLLYQVDFDKGY
jgi:phosphoglycerate dehydrogenase-like enzyme